MTIFFYILKDFLKYVIGIVILCVFLFILGDFIQRTTKYFAQYQPTTQEMLQMYMYQLPSQLIQILPIAALMGSVICMILMSRTNEITAMRAAGMGPLKVGLPILIGGAAISVIAFCLGEFVLPKSASRLHYVKEVLIEGSKEHGTTGESRWFRDRNRLFTFQEYDRINRILRSPKVIETGMNNRPVTAIHADSAYYESSLGVWEMRNVRRVHFTPSGTILNISKAPDQLIEIPVEPDKLQKDRRKPNELSLFELTDLVNRGRESGASITALNVERHLKFAFYFSSFFWSSFSLICLAFSTVSLGSVSAPFFIF